MQRFLRTPEEGADTVLWLACKEDLDRETGGFFFDRRRRFTHWLPWTLEADEDREALWAACLAASGVDWSYPESE